MTIIVVDDGKVYTDSFIMEGNNYAYDFCHYGPKVHEHPKKYYRVFRSGLQIDEIEGAAAFFEEFLKIITSDTLGMKDLENATVGSVMEDHYFLMQVWSGVFFYSAANKSIKIVKGDRSFGNAKGLYSLFRASAVSPWDTINKIVAAGSHSTGGEVRVYSPLDLQRPPLKKTKVKK